MPAHYESVGEKKTNPAFIVCLALEYRNVIDLGLAIRQRNGKSMFMMKVSPKSCHEQPREQLSRTES